MLVNLFQIYIILTTIQIVKASKKLIDNKMEYYYAPNLCFYNKAPCTNYKIDNLKYKKILNYKVLYK